MSSRKLQPRKRQQKVGRGLKGFADAKKTNIDLLKDIQSHVVAEGNKNAGAGRESHKIHVSELVKSHACPRHLTYKITKVEPTDPPAAAYHRLEMIWAAGNAEHEKWQRWLKEMGDLWGSWRCMTCTHEWEALSPSECTECGSSLLEYREVDLDVESHYLVGHADGAVPRLETLVEVKSFSVGSVRMDDAKLVSTHTHKVDGRTLVDHEGLWNAVKRPLRSHLKQGMMYLWMCKQLGMPFERITFIYENKTTQATKTFEVKLSERFIREHLDVLEEVLEHAKNGTLPKRPALFDRESRPCKDCVFRSTCWEEETSDNHGEESAAVPSRRPRSRSEETGGEAEVRTARQAREGSAAGSRRHHRTGRPQSDRDDDAADQVGRAPRRATRDGRGRRAVGRSGDGQGTGARFTRQR